MTTLPASAFARPGVAVGVLFLDDTDLGAAVVPLDKDFLDLPVQATSSPAKVPAWLTSDGRGLPAQTADGRARGGPRRAAADAGGVPPAAAARGGDHGRPDGSRGGRQRDPGARLTRRRGTARRCPRCSTSTAVASWSAASTWSTRQAASLARRRRRDGRLRRVPPRSRASVPGRHRGPPRTPLGLLVALPRQRARRRPGVPRRRGQQRRRRPRRRPRAARPDRGGPHPLPPLQFLGIPEPRRPAGDGEHGQRFVDTPCGRCGQEPSAAGASTSAPRPWRSPPRPTPRRARAEGPWPARRLVPTMSTLLSTTRSATRASSTRSASSRPGVSVELHQFAGTFHGSTTCSVEVSRRQQAEMVDALRRGVGL